MGICVGMEMLFEKSCEFGCNKGLGLIPGEECEYVLSLKKGEKNSYDLNLKFTELEEKINNK